MDLRISRCHEKHVLLPGLGADDRRAVVEGRSCEVWLREGSPRQVEAAVLLLFPWLRSRDPADQGDLQVLLEDLASQQAFIVEVISAATS